MIPENKTRFTVVEAYEDTEDTPTVVLQGANAENGVMTLTFRGKGVDLEGIVIGQSVKFTWDQIGLATLRNTVWDASLSSD